MKCPVCKTVLNETNISHSFFGLPKIVDMTADCPYCDYRSQVRGSRYQISFGNNCWQFDGNDPFVTASIRREILNELLKSKPSFNVLEPEE